MFLSAGAIAFVGFNADGNNDFAFVVLNNINVGETIHFTDNRWDGTAFATNEGTFTWTANAFVAAGTVISINATSNSGSVNATTGTISNPVGTMDLAASNEVLYAYQGSTTSPSFIAAIANSGFTPTNGTLTNTGLIAGSTAIAFTGGPDVAVYTGSRSGQASFAAYRSLINNSANWQTQDGAGNQSSDGTAPDIPFSSTAFAINALTPTVNLSVSSSTGTEAGQTIITITATASSAVTGNQTVGLNVTGTNITAVDYSLSNGGIITIPNGQTTGSITFTVTNDILVESLETATLTLSNPSSGITLGSTTSQTISIISDDVEPPDLSSGITTPGPLAVGIPFNYTLDVQNNGGSDATGVDLTFTLPANVTYNSFDILEGGFGAPTFSGSTLTFTGGSITAGSFAQIQVNVTPTQAGTLDGTTLVADPNNTIAESSELNNSVTTPTFTVNPAPGITITQSDGDTNLTEGGATDTYTVVLDSRPMTTVTVNLNADAQTSATPTNPLIFTPTNWNTPQTVTVSAIDDAVTENTHSGKITHTITSTDTRYNGMTVASVTATITDNDRRPTDILLNTNQINENVLTKTLVATLTTLDPDGGSFKYELVEGTDSTHNSAFSITDDQLFIQTSPDFETQSVYKIRIRTTDSSDLSYEKAIEILVKDLNDAPMLNNTTVSLNAVRLNATVPVSAVGTLISQLADRTGGTGQNNVIDPDAGSKQGIAITAADTNNGNWFYSTNNGTNWKLLDPVSDRNARLLAADANTRLYFQPNAGYQGNITDAITFRAWDQTSGTNGNLADTTTNGGATAFSTATDTASIEVSNSQIVDFNSDSKTDLLWFNTKTGALSVWTMDGGDRLNAQTIATVSLTSGWRPVDTGDFTGDGKTDILWRNRFTGANTIWEMRGTVRERSISLNAASVGWDVAGVGDFTGDGKIDILWRHRSTGAGGLWEMNGTNRSRSLAVAARSIASGWSVATVGDLTGDGKADILWQNRFMGTSEYWEMDGATAKGTTSLEPDRVASGLTIVGMGDFTKDGKTDILWWNRLDGKLAAWEMSGAAQTGSITLSPTVLPSSGWTLV